MKVKRTFTRAVSILLTLTMLLSLLPLQIFAVNEFATDEAIFKNMQLFSAENKRPISISFSADITKPDEDGDNPTWAKLSVFSHYSERSQR